MRPRKEDRPLGTFLQAPAIMLGALTLWAPVAVQSAPLVISNITMVGATPRFAFRSDLSVTNQIQYCTNPSQGCAIEGLNL